MRKYSRYVSIPEFLSLLEKTPRNWDVSEEGEIRANECICPISAVFGAVDLSRSSNIGLSIENKNKVMKAADTDEDSPLRNCLLRACGLMDDKEGIEDEEFEEEEPSQYCGLCEVRIDDFTGECEC